MKPNIKFILTILGVIIFVGGLALFAFLGFYNRFWADDWCYNADLKTLGLFGALRGYTYITAYASNRFSLTLFSGLLYPLRIYGVQIMTPLVILLWLTGLIWLLYNIFKIIGLSINSLFLTFAASIPLYYTIYLAPHLYQDLYWRSGLLPYTAPIVFCTWIFVLITRQCILEKPSRLTNFLIAPLAFLAGGFSEVGCATLATLLMLFVFIAAIGVYKKRPWAVKSIHTAIIALIFVFLAMIILIVSPTSQIRMARYGEPASLTRLPYLITFLSYQFLRLSIKDIPIPHFVLMMTCALLGYILSDPGRRFISFRMLVYLLLAIAVVAIISIAASHSPSAYIEQGPIAVRARIIPRFIMLTTLAIISALIGYELRQRYDSKWLLYIGVILTMLGYAYAVRSILITSDNIQIYASRADIWDERDRILRQAAANGSDEIHVRAIDGYPVGGIRDFKPQAGHWVNQCAEHYYGVKAIRADLP